MNKNNFLEWILLFSWVFILCMYNIEPIFMYYSEFWFYNNVTYFALAYIVWAIYRITSQIENAPTDD